METSNACRILAGKPFVTLSLIKQKRYKGNIKVDVRELECEDGRRIEQVQGRV